MQVRTEQLASRVAGAALVAGTLVLVASIALQVILLERTWFVLAGLAVGMVGVIFGLAGLRSDLAVLFDRRRREIALFAVGTVALILILIYLSSRFTYRLDVTRGGVNSLSPPTVAMLDRLREPVRIVFFHDALMRETVERYELFAARTDRISLELHDPTIEPARARLLGVQFPGTAVMMSGDRRLLVHGGSEVDIANGILRVSRGATQRICSLDGHNEADPFSQESHDHLEGTPGSEHSHGIGAEYVLHERHGMAKARSSLETLNFEVVKISLLKNPKALIGCTVLLVVGPKTALLNREVQAIDAYLAAGGHGLMMLEPFVTTGLEPLLRSYGIVLDNTIVIDKASHYWTDISSPAVTDYNNHRITRGLPLSFYPGARSLSPTPERVPGTRVIPLINSSTNSYGETSPDRAELDPSSDRPGPLTLMVVASRRPVGKGDQTIATLTGTPSPQTGRTDPRRPPVTALSRLAVFGDADFATNSFFHILGNGEVFLNTIQFLAGEEDLIGIEPGTKDLPRLTVTNRQIKSTFILSVLFAPFVLGLIGAVTWWRQR